jgi:hypothetical protein
MKLDDTKEPWTEVCITVANPMGAFVPAPRWGPGYTTSSDTSFTLSMGLFAVDGMADLILYTLPEDMPQI